VFKIIENFVSYESYEEAAPISTLETAFNIILLEYSELLLTQYAQTTQRSHGIPVVIDKAYNLSDEQINQI
jgi:hypothetical protein